MEDPLDPFPGFDLFDPLNEQFDSEMDAMERTTNVLTLLLKHFMSQGDPPATIIGRIRVILEAWECEEPWHTGRY